MSLSNPFVKGIIGGFLGVLFALFLYQAYLDHKTLWEVVAFINRSQAKDGKANAN
jgi:hypothetical protein